MRDWMELFVAGKRLHDMDDTTLLLADNAVEPVISNDRHQLLSDADFNEYRVSHHYLLATSPFAVN